jgi:hypothetical protein
MTTLIPIGRNHIIWRQTLQRICAETKLLIIHFTKIWRLMVFEQSGSFRILTSRGLPVEQQLLQPSVLDPLFEMSASLISH